MFEHSAWLIRIGDYNSTLFRNIIINYIVRFTYVKQAPYFAIIIIYNILTFVKQDRLLFRKATSCLRTINIDNILIYNINTWYNNTLLFFPAFQYLCRAAVKSRVYRIDN